MVAVPKPIQMNNHQEMFCHNAPYAYQPGSMLARASMNHLRSSIRRNINDMQDSRSSQNFLSIRYEASRIKIKIAMCNYKPDDLKVEIHGNYLVIDARHPERKEKHGFVSREYRRRIYLPESAILEQVNGKWSPFKWLSIYVPFVYNPETFGLLETTEPPAPAPRPIRITNVPIRIVEF